MKRLSLWTLVFAILSLVFIDLLVFLRTPFSLYSLMSYQDAFDLLTPVVLIPLYWILFRYAGRDMPSLAEEIAFLVLVALWVEGQGMHLAANSSSNLMEDLADDNLIDLTANDLFDLIHFYDEGLSHVLWHASLLGLAALLMVREWRAPAGLLTTWWFAVPAGIMYGFMLFAQGVEGQVVWMGLPFVLLVTVAGLVWGRKRLGQQPVFAFFFLSCLVALLFYISWGVFWGGFPEFSEVGWL
jgi:hypothetical protein